MFVKKTIKKPEVRSIEVTVKDFERGIDTATGENITSYNYAVSCYNFNFKSGVLTEGVGFEKLKLPVSKTDSTEELLPINDGFDVDINHVWRYKQFSNVQNMRIDKLMFWAGDGYTYFIRLFSQWPYYNRLTTLNFHEKPSTNNFKILGFDSMIMSNATDGLFTWNGEGGPIAWPNAPKIVSLADHKNRLYATFSGEKNFIRYSSNYHLTQWSIDTLASGEGVIEMNDERERITKLISFLGYLFAFRDYGIAKIITYENSSQFNVSQLFVSGSRIYAETVAVCGDNILMLTRDGIFEFDGINTNKIDLKLNKLFDGIDNTGAMGVYHSGIYYLSCRLNYQDDRDVGCEKTASHKNNSLICYDVKNKTYNIVRGIDIASMASIQVDSMDKLVLCFNTDFKKELGQLSQSGMFFENRVEKYWASPLSDLGFSDKQKFVREISLLSKTNCRLTVFTEREEKTFEVLGSNVISKFAVRLKGKQIGFKIETSENKAYISDVKLKVDLLESEYC